ncbi:two-component sensor histidine kinase [Brachybacterium sp. P6-10-X1]|uniref:sensor histidine kinase n=1 Tax=Brachybacterium sp. P6-10-X1 TaxID=1903186 RepID=UPI0009717B16|nr:ATP-binding protein [Brachybacterium sp. P6-10-X1]APX34594.1 two-component sensor histidine kinase [Brachybacterium sp. P6-10-X1]
MIGQLIVLLAGALTITVLTVIIGPAVFHYHLLQTDLPVGSAELVHIERAYRDALALALGVGLVVALLAAGLVTWNLARRLRQTLHGLTTAVDELSRGHYSTRVPSVGAGTELDSLAATLNDMAARLDAVEETRRQLLSDLAHELRTPIATLSAHHEAMADGVIEPEATMPILAGQTVRLSRLADDISEVSRAEEGQLPLQLHPLAVDDLLASALKEWEERFETAGVALRRETALPDSVAIHADPDRLAQVLGNLLSNALRHTSPGGAVTLSATTHGSTVEIAVADDGEGFTAEDRSRLFERFFRADSSRTRENSGSGIGLTISRALLDAHGGTMTAASEGPGRGATFTIRLPRAIADR